MRSSAKFLFGLGLVGLCVLAAPTATHATLTLTLSVTRTDSNNVTSTQTETVPTNSGGSIFYGPGLNSYPGSAGFVIPFDGFTIQGQANSTLLPISLLDSPSTITNTGLGTATLTMTLTDDGETTPISYGYALSSNATFVSATGTATMTFQSTVGSTTGHTGAGTQTPLITFTQATPPAQRNTSTYATILAVPGQPFSLTNTATFTLSSGATISGFTGTSTISTPEPGTLAAALAGAPVAGLFFWRRRQARTATQA